MAHGYADREILSDVTFEVASGAALLVGAPGAGKSVLMRLLCGLERPWRGWITVDGLPVATNEEDVLAAHRRRLAIVPQQTLFVRDRSVASNVSLALETIGVAAGEAHERAGEMLERVGAAYLMDRLPKALSEGEARLVALARGLVRQDARIIVADEPMQGLDRAAQHRAGELLAERAERGATVLVTSQEPSLPGLDATRVVFLEEGRVTWDSAPRNAAEAS